MPRAAPLLLLIVLLGPAASAQNAPVPARDAAARMTLPEGFKATLFAGEPDVVQPIAFTFDDRGRVWVVENHSYPGWPGTPTDRVLIFEDSDNDGRFDKKTVFWDQGRNLSGINLGYGGVWLCSVPNLIFVPDADKDDRPDGPPKTLLDGWDLNAKHNVFNASHGAPTAGSTAATGSPRIRRSASPARPMPTASRSIAASGDTIRPGGRSRSCSTGRPTPGVSTSTSTASSSSPTA